MKLLPIKIFRIAEHSMEPSIKHGDYLLVKCWYRRLGIGEVVLVKSPEDDKILVKRIEHLDDGKVFVIGDNKEWSRDSRNFGAIESRRVLGKVMFKI